MTRSRSLLLPLCAALGLSLAPITAGAFTIDTTDIPSFTTFVDLGYATATAGGGEFIHKVSGGYDSVGVFSGYEYGEIDLSGPESITFAFTEAQIVTELSLGKLYAALEEDDVYDEQALVTATFADGSSASYVLAVTSGTTAAWTGAGTVSNVSPGLFGMGGVWSLADPFGSAAVKAITLSPIGPDMPASYRNNDYGFVSLSTTAVPESETMALMSLGLAGLALMGRKRASA